VRKDRAFTALVSVAVVATIATAALTIYSDLEANSAASFAARRQRARQQDFRRFD